MALIGLHCRSNAHEQHKDIFDKEGIVAHGKKISKCHQFGKRCEWAGKTLLIKQPMRQQRLLEPRRHKLIALAICAIFAVGLGVPLGIHFMPSSDIIDTDKTGN